MIRGWGKEGWELLSPTERTALYEAEIACWKQQDTAAKKNALAYYGGGVRVVKNGVPVKLAAWYPTLTAEGKRLVGSINIMVPYNPKYINLT